MTPDMFFGYMMVFGPPVVMTYCAVILTLIYRRLGKPTMLGIAVQALPMHKRNPDEPR